MSSFQCVVPVWLILAMAAGTCALVGCVQEFAEPTASTTTPPAPAPELVGQPEQPELPEPPQSPAPPDEVASIATEPAAPAVKPVLGKLVAIELDLPAPAFRGTPVPLKEPNVEKPAGKPREPFLAPQGTRNQSRGKAVASSDPAPASGEFDLVTDGDKEASDFGYLELRPGSEWVQIDLGQKRTIYAVLVWHNHAEARVYRDVIVQVSDDPDFLDAQTVFNNDYDNSSGLGIGNDMGYVETSEGKLIDCRGVEGRYVRLYSKGNHIDGENHYTEVEIYGR